MTTSIAAFQRKWHWKRFLSCLLWSLFWCGSGLAAIEFFYGPGEGFANAHPYLMGGTTAIFLVAVPVSLGFFLARLFGLFRWKGRLEKQVRRYLPQEETQDAIRLLEADLKCRLFGYEDIFLGRDWVVFPGQAMKRDAIVGIYYTNLDQSLFSKQVRITLVDEEGELISCQVPWGEGSPCWNFLTEMHPWAARGDFREYTFFLQKEGEKADRRKLRVPQKTYQLGVSKWDRSPILEENTIDWEYERWLLASYAPYIAGDPYLHGDYNHVGGWERTVFQQQLAKEVLEGPWEVFNKEDLLSTVEHLVATGQLGHDGWQLGRAMMVLGFGYIAGYLTRRELLWYSLPAGEAIQRTFSSWKELHDSYMESYEQWSKKSKKRNLRRKAYQQLLKDPGSILNTVPFNMSLPGRCHEAMKPLAQEAEPVNEV